MQIPSPSPPLCPFQRHLNHGLHHHHHRHHRHPNQWVGCSSLWWLQCYSVMPADFVFDASCMFNILKTCKLTMISMYVCIISK
ncbi:hypothetical protein Hanom_Chr04g00327981 [Helianthus anomalus]